MTGHDNEISRVLGYLELTILLNTLPPTIIDYYKYPSLPNLHATTVFIWEQSERTTVCCLAALPFAV